MLLIYSGGMDSTVMLHEFKKLIKLTVNFNYGSKHNEMERKYAEANAKALNIPLLKVDLPFVNDFFKSDLLKAGGDIPEGHYEDESMKRTVVPFRNGIMLSIAIGLAESRGLTTVMYANHTGDHAIYPDCRTEFQTAMNKAAQAGTYLKVRIRSPYGADTKRTIALRGRELRVDFTQTYSCYKGEAIHCGRCGTCTERKEALEGFDPTLYEE